MSFKEKLSQNYADAYLKRYGDRLTQVQGNAVSVKIEEKTILWIFHKIHVTILVRPERSKTVVKCIYKKNRWFKKPSFITVSQGNLLLIQGLKGKKGKGNREQVDVINIKNISTKKDLVPVKGDNGQKIQRVQKIQRFK